MKIQFWTYVFIICFPLTIISQNHTHDWKPHFENHVLSSDVQNDYDEYDITNEHVSLRSGILHVYLIQKNDGITVDNGKLSLHIDKNGKLITIHDQFVQNLTSKIIPLSTILPAENLLDTLLKQMNVTDQLDWEVVSISTAPDQKTIIDSRGYFYKDIIASLKYFQDSSGFVKLCWEFQYETKNGKENWVIKVDPVNGKILDKYNMVLSCSFAPEVESGQSGKLLFTPMANSSALMVSGYRAFPLKVESPNHGVRQFLANAVDTVASPFGWHDTDGVPGPEHTTTKGNNVETREDIDGNNETLGAMAEGGSELVFDFPLSLNLHPHLSQNASITNLFYWNNIIHDIIYQYGFDESAGNFQTNNYGNGGSGNDHVLADALDGGGINNANFSTPVDGNAPRMQMYLWNTGKSLVINTPPPIAGNYIIEKAAFGPETFNVTGNVIMVRDSTTQPSLGCHYLINGPQVAGKIAMVDNGNCEYGKKCLNAQNAGAIAVIVCHDQPGNPLVMDPGSFGTNVTIPSIMMKKVDCDSIKVYLSSGVNLTIISGIPVDGDYDNGIIMHEYGHGISIRLTGGAGNSDCLNNQEQMGEGWSDWYGLMVTMEEDDIESRARGIGTFALGQTPTGPGIRTFRYSTDMTINPHTYNSIITEAIPHGVGSVWCAMLWELTWALIREYGYDPDLYYGTGGNNMAMALVTEALKLQPCQPGFVDGRNAILAADNNLYNGANHCLIWKSFAKRGLGYGASQGQSNSRSDGSQAFDMPPSCCKYVSNTTNSGNGSLREAVGCALQGDTIHFLNFIKDDVISLTTQSIVINRSITVSHPESWSLILKSTGNFPVFETSQNILLENLNFEAGTGGSARVIHNTGNLVLKNIEILDHLLNSNNGQTIMNEGTISVEGTLLIEE